MKEPEPKKAKEARQRTKGEEKSESNTQVKSIHLIMSLKKKLEVISLQCIGHPVAHNLWCIMHRSN